MKELYMAQAISDAMGHAMENDDKVFLIGEDVGKVGGAFGASVGLYEKFGKERVRDTPITEQAIVGLSAGAALTGMRPIAEIMYNDFMGCAMDLIMNQMAKFRYMYGGKWNVPMVLRMANGGALQCGAQHSQSLEAMLVHIPGLKVVCPSTPADARGLLLSSIKDDNPVIFMEHQMLYALQGEVPDEYEEIPLGIADVKREGSDITVVATELCVHKALEAAEELETEENVSVEVIDPRTLYPLDKETIYKSVKKTGKLVVATEECKRGAWSGELSAMIAEDMFDALDRKIVRVGALNVPIPYSITLEEYALPQKDDIKNAIKDVLA